MLTKSRDRIENLTSINNNIISVSCILAVEKGMSDMKDEETEKKEETAEVKKTEVTKDNKTTSKEKKDHDTDNDSTEHHDEDSSDSPSAQEDSNEQQITAKNSRDEEAKDDGSKEDGKEEKSKEPKKDWSNWPLKHIDEPHDNDVLYGRGGGTNHHPGNKRYRKMVEDRKLDYVNSKRLDKPLVALGIIREWRGQEPPGRFLKIDEKTGLWNDVGDKKAREKTSQALREKAPLIRKAQEEERMYKDGSMDEDDDDEPRSTRFAEGTNMNSNEHDDVKKAILARDHSLGREYLDEGEAVTLDGFSWQDPIDSANGRGSSGIMSRTSSGARTGPLGPPAMPMLPNSNVPPPHSKTPSIGPDPYRYPSQGSMGPPPPGYMSGDDRHVRYASHGRYESWSSLPPGPPPPPIPGYGYPAPSIGSWTREQSVQREHSLSHYPLPNASVSQPAPYAFDSRHGSTSSWGPHGHSNHSPYPPSYGPPPPPPPPSHHAYPPPPTMSRDPQEYGPYRETPPSPVYQMDNREYGGQRSVPPSPTYPPEARDYGGQHHRPGSGGPHSPYGGHHHRRGSSGPPSPPYAVDLAVASKWSGQPSYEINKTWSHGSESEIHDNSAYARGHARSGSRSPPRPPVAQYPRPDVVKRITSNQNETYETKPDLRGPSVKRCALNRDRSAAANRLKEMYIPGWQKKNPFNAEREVSQLTDNLELSTLGTNGVERKALSSEGRVSTYDVIAMDLALKPVSLSATNRSSTIEALDLDLYNDLPIPKPGQVERKKTMEEVFEALKEKMPKPPTINSNDRLTTSDFFDMVNEPLGDDDDIVGLVKNRRDKPFLSRDSSIGANSIGDWVDV